MRPWCDNTMVAIKWSYHKLDKALSRQQLTQEFRASFDESEFNFYNQTNPSVDGLRDQIALGIARSLINQRGAIGAAIGLAWVFPI